MMASSMYRPLDCIACEIQATQSRRWSISLTRFRVVGFAEAMEHLGILGRL